MAKVTVIIPNYNHADYLLQRLDSIRLQTYTDWEAIIIDDASTDRSANLITDYLNSNEFHLKEFIKQKENSGSGYKSWQKGIRLAKSKYIWIAETDDYCEPEFLQEAIEALDANPDVGLAFTASHYVDEKGALLYNTDRRFSMLGINDGEVLRYKSQMLTNHLPLNPLITNGSAVVFRNPESVLPEALFQNKQLSDLFLWQYLLIDKDFVCINKKLNYFRRHSESTTTKNFNHNSHTVYEEYSRFANYFKIGTAKNKTIVSHYVKHFLIPNRKSLGLFHLKPVKDISLSKLVKFTILVKQYLKHIIKRH